MIRIVKADNNIKEKLGLTHDAFCVFDGDDLSGFCEYALTPPTAQIISIKCNDNMLKDGLVRQTLNFALDNGCPTAVFDDKVRNELTFLGILRNDCENSFNILEFFAKLNGVEIF